MNTRTMLLLIGGALALAAVGTGGWLLGKRGASPATTAAAAPAAGPQKPGDIDPATGKKVLYWHDPMVPGQRFDKPGKSPFMDMMLVPKLADDEGGGVKIDPRVAHSLGVRLAAATREQLAPRVAAVATVSLNERDIAIVQARAAGYVERVYARAPGDVIAAGTPLADVLVPEWLGAQQELLALEAAGDTQLAAAARQRLVLLGMTESQIAQIEQSGQPSAVLTVAAPIGGVIQELMLRQGMAVMAGATLARINGLATVWLEAAVPEAHAALLAPGRAVGARFAAYPDESFDGKIAAVLPEANRDTRTLRVRMEFPNRAQKLKAGMFAQVAFSGPPETALVVPSEAVIRTGQRALVYVAVADQPGRYTPVEVQLGREVDGKLVVTRGLSEGQQVVASGQFLIDSEASLAGVVGRGAPQAKAPAAPLHEGVGVVTEIGADEITLSHEPIPSMQWGAMQMPFKVGSPDQLKVAKAGEWVRFRFRQDKDGFVLDSLERAKK
jgi:Cu(I)/Ag(I) efflux system membrane fusion protein